MIKLLDEILLSDNVVDKFNLYYRDTKFKNWLDSILPEVENCRLQNQDNPWHIFNCMDHILHSVEEINRQTVGMEFSVRRMLAYTMFLHDIGKPKCYIRRYSKLYRREVDSFFDHNKAGVKIASRVLDSFGFNEIERQIIKTLIYEHDMFMFITLKADGNPYHKVLTEEVLKGKIKELSGSISGKTILEYLIMVGRADNRAQNPSMTGESLRLIQIMDEMLRKIKA